MKLKRLRRIGCGALTVSAAASCLSWALGTVVFVRSYWRADHVTISSGNSWSERSSARGRFYVRVRAYLPERISPFHFDRDWGWFSSPDPMRFAQNMQRQRQELGVDPWEFAGFRAACGDPARAVGGNVWLRFAEGPLWPALVILAIVPACWLWRRRFWPPEERRRATRGLLLTSSVLLAIPAVLLALLFVNFRFLGLGETPLCGRTSHPSTPLAADVNGVILKVMTYNIWMGGAYRGAWCFERPERVAERIAEIAAVIHEQQPDVVFLQEVVLESGPGSFNQAPVLAEKARMHMWTFGQCLNDGLPFYRMCEGNAILSRWPVEPLTNQKMARHRAFHEIGCDNQSTLWCKTVIGGREILLASVHLTSGDDDPGSQVEQILGFAGSRSAILAGDFNAEPNDPEIQRIMDTSRFVAKLDGSSTIPSYDPHAIIDYIFVPPDWQLLEHRVIQTGLSDHLPVVAAYRIPYKVGLSGY